MKSVKKSTKVAMSFVFSLVLSTQIILPVSAKIGDAQIIKNHVTSAYELRANSLVAKFENAQLNFNTPSYLTILRRPDDGKIYNLTF